MNLLLKKLDRLLFSVVILTITSWCAIGATAYMEHKQLPPLQEQVKQMATSESEFQWARIRWEIEAETKARLQSDRIKALEDKLNGNH